MKKALIAGAASVALAAMPVVGVFAADIQDITDTIEVTIAPTCSFDTNEGAASASNENYSATVLNGAEAAFNGGGKHTFHVVCNNNGGYTVSATPTNLVGTLPATGEKNNIPYTVSYNATGKAGMWTAIAASTDSHNPTVVTPVPAAGGVIVTDAKTDGTTFDVTYKAYVGTETPADTYTGTMTYSLDEL